MGRVVEFQHEQRAVVTYPDGRTETWPMVVEVTYRRYDLPAALRDVWQGLVVERFPVCCVLAYAWTAFWHGPPALLREHQHGDWPAQANYVPCPWHLNRRERG